MTPVSSTVSVAMFMSRFCFVGCVSIVWLITIFSVICVWYITKYVTLIWKQSYFMKFYSGYVTTIPLFRLYHRHHHHFWPAPLWVHSPSCSQQPLQSGRFWTILTASVNVGLCDSWSFRTVFIHVIRGRLRVN